MSQAGLNNTSQGPVPVTVATSYVTNSGTAIPAANILNVLGAGGTVTSGSGNTITITVSGSGMTWSSISASQTLSVNNGYFCTGGAGLSLALPAVSAVGDEITVVLDGSTSWTITQPNAATQIRIGNQQTTLGVGGSLASTAAGDTITLVCETANARWVVISSIGNITFV